MLVVDDRRSFPDLEPVLSARTSATATAMLTAVEAVGGSLDQLLLDQDLGRLPDGTADDVGPVLAWLRERAAHGHRLPVGEVTVVTADPWGRGSSSAPSAPTTA